MKKDHTSLRRLINEMAALSPSSIKIAGPLIEFNTGTRKLLYDLFIESCSAKDNTDFEGNAD